VVEIRGSVENLPRGLACSQYQNLFAPHQTQSIDQLSTSSERVVSRNGVREFLIVEHIANVRKNSKTSAIWHHGGERRRLDDHSVEKAPSLDHVTAHCT
jgi:peptidase E